MKVSEITFTQEEVTETKKEKFTGNKMNGTMTHKKGWSIVLTDNQKETIKNNFDNSEELISKIQRKEQATRKEIKSDLIYNLTAGFSSDYFKALEMIYTVK